MPNVFDRSSSAILTWHSLDDSGSVISTPPSIFRQQIESLVESGVPVVPLEKVHSTPGSVALTFDDGCRNLSSHAFPLLERNNLPATVFVVSGYSGKTNRWPSQPSGAIPELPLLSWEEIAARPATVSIGAHTVTHPHLDRLSGDECDRELRECRDEIEQKLQTPVRAIAYPYGDSSEQVRHAAARYFQFGAGTAFRFLSPHSDLLNLPRIDMYYFRGRASIDRLFAVTTRFYVGLRGFLREGRTRILG